MTSFFFQDEETMCLEVKSGKGVRSPLPANLLPSEKSDGTEEFVMTDSVDGCSVLSETHFVGT